METADLRDCYDPSGGSPSWIRSAHQTNQIAYVFRNRRTPGLAMPDLPGPKKAKAFSVPSDHSLGIDDDECGAPVIPHPRTAKPRGAGRGVSTSASSQND